MRQPPMPDLRKSSGAFDLPSIMTGVIVVGILAAGVLAAIFGVIPYTQNNGAKQDLSAIRTAEGVARAKDNRFMDHAGLIDTGYLQLASTEKTKVMADEKGTCYVALAKSGTGKVFYSTDTRTDPELFEADTDPGCLPAEKLAELVDSVGGIDTPKGAPANLKLAAVSPLQARASWDPVKKADGYKVEYRAGDATEWTVRHERIAGNTTAIPGMPEETLHVRVYALTGESVSEPSSASVKLPDSVLKNPSFELGAQGWNLYDAVISSGSATAHSGTKSAQFSTYGDISQTVIVPADSPVLTYWTSGAPEVRINNVKYAPASATRESGWTQYRLDLSGSASKSVTIRFDGSSGYLDDVTLEAPMAPLAPASAAASSNNGNATVTWGTPPFSGGTPITSYTVTAWLDGEEQASTNVGPDNRAAIIRGLKVGAEYTFTVHANNAAGESAPGKTGPVAIIAGAVANPSFELGAQGWNLYDAVISSGSATAHSGTKSAQFSTYGDISQTVIVPADSPVLTYWTSGAPEVRINNVKYAPASATRESGWTQYRLDLSGSASKSVTIRFDGSSGYLDDVTLEAPMAPLAPASAAASSNNGNATVTWGTPPFSGGTPITSYTVTAWLDGEEQASTNVGPDNRAAIIRGLKVGAEYTFTVHANNAAGESAPGKTGPVAIIAGAVANPSFELGAQGWNLYDAVISSGSATAHSGTKSAQFSTYGDISQTVIVPADSPVLTYWTSGAPEVRINNVKYAPASATRESGWTQYRLDLSGSASKSVTIRFDGSSGYLDDVTLEAPMAPFAPASAAATSKSGTATVTWGVPPFSGGTPITSYTVTAWLDGKEADSVQVEGSQRTATLTRVTVGETYTFSVTANNAVGASTPRTVEPMTISAAAFVNPGFEDGITGWSGNPKFTAGAHSGTTAAKLQYAGMSQVVTIRPDAPVLTWWSRDYTPNVTVNGRTVSTTYWLNSTEWRKRIVDLSEYAGTSVTVKFANDKGYDVLLDDISMEAK